MDAELVISMIFKVVGGLGVFLLGMSNLTNGLQTIAGDRLRWLISKITGNRIFAALVGVFVTMVVQSSSITTVMVVGFVNSSLMTLTQAIGVIMGANIGTTITGWVIAVKIGKYGLPILGVAALVMLFSKKDRVKFIAMAAMGLGMVFFGLELMKSGFKPIRSIPEFAQWFQMFHATSYIGILGCIGVSSLLTMIVQSSSATLGITMSLAATGVIGFETAAALVLGGNIGTTITAFLASIGAKTNARRAAYAHIIFNTLGVVWISLLFPIYITLVKKFLGLDPDLAVQAVNEAGALVTTFPHIEVGIATVHTGFNVVNTLLFLIFVPQLAKLLIKIVPDPEFEERARITKLDGRMMDTPQIALQQSQQEIINIFSICKRMLTSLHVIIIESKGKDSKTIQRIFKDEEVVDVMQKEITEYLTELMSANMATAESLESKQQLRIADELETISDYITNIVKIYLKLSDRDIVLSDNSIEDIKQLHKKITSYLEFVWSGYANDNHELLTLAAPEGESIKFLFKDIRNKSLDELSSGESDPITSLGFIDILNSYRRINDHILNVAEETTND